MTQERITQDEKDAARYRWLRDKLENSVGGGVEVNDDKLVYNEPEPGKEVRIFWYPDTPVGFHQIEASTLDKTIDEGMTAEDGK